MEANKKINKLKRISCEYGTNIKKHLLSKKHIENQQPRIDNEESCKHQCNNCNKKYEG